MQLSEKTIGTSILDFLKRQYFVLFFMLAIGIKFCLFNLLIGLNPADPQAIAGYVSSFLTAFIIFMPLLFIKKVKKPLAFLLALVLSLILYFDLIYFRFFQSLPTFGMMDAISQASDIAPSITALMRFTDIILFADLFIIGIFEAVSLWIIKVPWQGQHKEAEVGKIEKILLGTLLVTLAVIGLVFTFARVPRQRLADALSWSFETRYNTQYFGVIGSHFIDGYRFFEEQSTKVTPEVTKEVQDWVGANLKTEAPVDSSTGIAEGKRVIMIQVESLGTFVVDGKVKGQAITPNLNSFKKEAHYFANNRFVIGSGHTSDTDLVANSSLYPLYDSAAFVRYGKDNYSGLAKVLTQAGYKTEAYHAYNRNFWNRNVALGSLGYQKFLAAESMPKGNYINMNGLNDRDFLKFTESSIKSNPVKTLTYAITLSTHYPFAITNETKGLNINADDYPAFVGGYLQNVNYTDAALGDFIAKLKKDGLYDDSLIVIYGDHSPTIESFKSGSVSFDSKGVNAKKAPLLIKLPNQKVGVIHSETTTHLDIMPTILDLLGVKTVAPMFGQSVFVDADSALARCEGGEINHQPTLDCKTAIANAKAISAKIIKYNLFGAIIKSTDTQ
jgi:lipoteichoic acid synthase